MSNNNASNELNNRGEAFWLSATPPRVENVGLQGLSNWVFGGTDDFASEREYYKSLAEIKNKNRKQNPKRYMGGKRSKTFRRRTKRGRRK